jgi:hypothetical protein
MAEVMIYIKIHGSENGDIIAMCDSDLLGREIKEGEIEINLRDYSDFYKGELASGEKVVKMLKPERLLSANIVGRESVAVAVKAGVIDSASIKKVSKIPYAYAFRIKY